MAKMTGDASVAFLKELVRRAAQSLLEVGAEELDANFFDRVLSAMHSRNRKAGAGFAHSKNPGFY